MTDTIERYFDAISGRISELRSAERENIRKAASACAKSILNGGVVHIHDTGHMLNTELVGRAGGLVGFTPLSFGLNVANPNSFRDRTGEPKPDVEAEVIALALKRSHVRAGDVLIVGSVSGKSFNPVELAIRARALGVTVVAVTALAYSSKLEPQHPSGKRLFEAADIVIDNHAPYGDAMVEVPGLDSNVCPASGICAAVALWAVIAGIVEELVAAGKTPTVYPSVNRPDGRDLVSKAQKEYAERGY